MRFFDDTLRPGTVVVDDLVFVLERFQAALRSMIEAQADVRRTRGPRRNWIVEAGRLVLSGVHSGSFVAEIEVAAPSDLIDWAESALDEMLPQVATPWGLPDGPRSEFEAVARYLQRSNTVHAIEVVGWKPAHSARLTAEFASPQPALDSGSGALGPVTVQGRLLEVDWKDGQAELHAPVGLYRLTFDPQNEELADDLRLMARSLVIVEGTLTSSARPNEVGRLDVAGLRPARGGRFFSPRTPNEVASVTPTFRWDEHERVEFDVADFLAAIHGRE